jgi:DUF1680 family protein
MVTKKYYVQGGIGASGEGERFAGNYELPNETAYNETCAAIANVYWNQRMFLLHGDAKYIDVLERTLYNGLLSGVGMDGKSFFYTNAMEVEKTSHHHHLEAERAGWFPCSCCPTNITRLIPSVPGYMYAVKDDAIYVNLFAQSTGVMSLADRNEIQIAQENNYPWRGDLTFRISPKKSEQFRMLIRIPGWANNAVVPSDLYSFKNKNNKPIEILINGSRVNYTMDKGYAVLNRKWKTNDVISLSLPMNVKEIVSNDNVQDNTGKIALQSGPIVYCAEWVDNGGMTSNLILPEGSVFTTEFKNDLLNGVNVIHSSAIAINIDNAGRSVTSKPQAFTAIPYYAWAHRGKGEMEIWIPQKINFVEIISKDLSVTDK